MGFRTTVAILSVFWMQMPMGQSSLISVVSCIFSLTSCPTRAMNRHARRGKMKHTKNNTNPKTPGFAIHGRR